jgi:hypothetical protein
MDNDLTPADCCPDSLADMPHGDGSDAPLPGPPTEAWFLGWLEWKAEQAVEHAGDHFHGSLGRAGFLGRKTAFQEAIEKLKAVNAEGRAKGGTTGASPGNARAMPRPQDGNESPND